MDDVIWSQAPGWMQPYRAMVTHSRNRFSKFNYRDRQSRPRSKGELAAKFLKDILYGVPTMSGAQLVATTHGSQRIPGDEVRRAHRAAKMVKGQPSNKRKTAPQSKTASQSQTKRAKTMPRKSFPKYIGQGHYHGRFKKPTKRVKRLSFPVVQKTEGTGFESDPSCVYICHTTHPLKFVLKTIAMSMVHKYFAQCGIHIPTFKDPIGFQAAIGSVSKYNLAVATVHQGKPEGTSDATFTVVGDTTDPSIATFEDFAIQIADGLCLIYTNIASVETQPFFTQIQWRATGVTDSTLSSRNWDATEIKIAISGKSMVNLQNRTAAGDTADTSLTTSIYANPLHGKHYKVSGNGVRIKNLGASAVTPNTSAQLACNQSNGFVSNGATSTDVNAAAQDVLKQPPAGNYFYRCSKTSYIRLEPGSIKQSTCYSVVTKSFNRWLRDMQPWLETAADLGSLNNFYTAALGETRLIALEKVADMSSGNPIEVGFERDGIVRGKLWFNKKRATAALNSISL